MNVLDYVFLALVAVAFILGLFKGLIRQILTIVGVILVAALTATVEPYVQSWFVNTSMDEGTRNVVAMIATVILLTVAYALLALLITKLLKKVKIIGALDRILGGVLGLAVVYLVFAVIFALILNTEDGFLPLIKSFAGEAFQTSWIGEHIYGNNFFGDWIINGIAGKLLEGLQQGAAPEALAGFVTSIA